MSEEDRVRAALHRRAEALEPAEAEWTRVEWRKAAAVRRARRQMRTWGGLAAAAAVAVVVAAAATLPTEDAQRVEVTPGTTEAPGTTTEAPATTTTTEPATTTTEGPPAPRLPDTLVAATPDGRLVAISTATGRVVRVLDQGREAGSRIVAVTLGPDAAYFWRGDEGSGGDGTCPAPTIERVPLAGGTATRVTRGSYPAVSPDEARLAYLGPPDAQCRGRPLVVRDLATAAERRYPSGDAGAAGDSCCVWLAWSPEGDRLAYARAVADTYEVRLLDFAGNRTTRVGGGTGGESWEHPVFLTGERRMLLVSRRPGSGAGSRLVKVDPVTGRVEATVHTDNRPIIDLDVDATGRYVLYVTDDFRAYRLEAGKATLVATGVAEADW
jgi:hypothetical protein